MSLAYVYSNVPSTSRRTITRNLSTLFNTACEAFKTELLIHTASGGRISLTTDTWSSRNHKEFAAVTIHWINKDWIQQLRLLDIAELQELIHSSKYLAQILVDILDEFDITDLVFTVTRDNAGPNNTMLSE